MSTGLVMKDWAWTALNEATGFQYGRFATEQEADAEAVRLTQRTRNRHRAQRAVMQRGERLIAEVHCGECGDRLPDADGVVLHDPTEKILCGKCSVGQRRLDLRPLVHRTP